jgi:wobble nucleotide-excising tRNase
LKTEVEKLLHEEPPKDIVIDILENNKELYDWTKQGLEFKENKSECAFCGNKVTSDRLKKLNDYFSNASKILRDNISELYKLIDAEINSFEKMSIPKSKNDFVESIQENIEEQIKAFDQIKTDYKSSLLSLKVELARKEDGNIFTSININYIESTEVLLENWITKTNEYIETHNEFNKNYEDEKTNAQNKLKEHYIAHFLIDEDYYDKEHQAFYEKRCVERYRRISGRLKSENESLQNQLKTITIGKEKLNELIQKFLDTSFIKIDVTDDDKFLLKRGDKYAVNLSEGEKTAIAFSYFLIVLESLLKNNKLMDTIIFIDDPISSLDNNHIAQLYSLINSFFFRKGINTDSPEQVVNCFKQLFLSTHNFEFFSFLKDSNKINKKNSCNYYLIKRISEEESSIVDIPKSLSLYKSEYILLFEIIYNYHISEDKENNENTILLPNAVRRFLEIYTLMKIPHENASVETRINSLVGDTNEFKFLNHFSHFTSFEKLTKHDELIMILPKAVNELIKLLKNDFKHFESLKKAININQ